MPETRPSPRWFPIAGVTALLVLAALVFGPERALKLARGVVRIEPSFATLPAAAAWSLLLPTCIPTIVYNSILSWANGWYFLLACEIIVTGKVEYDLPGLGNTLSRSLARGDLKLATAALLTLILIVVALELVVWRPLRA